MKHEAGRGKNNSGNVLTITPLYSRMFLLSEQFSWGDPVMFYHLIIWSPINVNVSHSSCSNLVQSVSGLAFCYCMAPLHCSEAAGWQAGWQADVSELQLYKWPATPIECNGHNLVMEYFRLFTTMTWVRQHNTIIIHDNNDDNSVLFPICPHQ